MNFGFMRVWVRHRYTFTTVSHEPLETPGTSSPETKYLYVLRDDVDDIEGLVSYKKLYFGKLMTGCPR